MSSLSQAIAKNVVNLRRIKGLTQNQLSKLASIPRTTLTHLESGEGNPTLKVVERIAAGLQVKVEELMLSPRPETKLIKASNVPVDQRSRGKALLYKLLPDDIVGAEIDRLELESKARMKGVPHSPLTKEYLTCISGEVDLFCDGEKYSLKKGDVLAFPGDTAHSYYNPTAKKSICLSVVFVVPNG